jgi:hypothetical protein
MRGSQGKVLEISTGWTDATWGRDKEPGEPVGATIDGSVG